MEKTQNPNFFEIGPELQFFVKKMPHDATLLGLEMETKFANWD